MKKVLTYGTFDLFHQGHYNIIKRAKEYGDYLIVGVTSEIYDIERGKLSVRDGLAKRIENVQKTGLVDEIIIEEYLGQKIRDIIALEIDTLVIGSDWKGKFDHLREYCEVVYLERTKDISSSLIREQEFKIYNLGIASDSINDKDSIIESKYVSGIHIESIYASNHHLANNFREVYELDNYFTDYSLFLKSIDIVYINVHIEKRYELIKEALLSNKHIISESPFSLNELHNDELLELAKEKSLLLLENIIPLYLRAFTQLQWMAKGNLVGKILRVECKLSRDNFDYEVSVLDMITLSVATLVKILGVNDFHINKRHIIDSNEKLLYSKIDLDSTYATSTIEIGSRIKLENSLVIIGDKGKIVVDGNWWETGYFELSLYEKKNSKKFSFNFEGTGFRYLVQDLLIALRDKRLDFSRLFHNESKQVLKLINNFYDPNFDEIKIEQ